MGNSAKAGINDLATTHPELASQWHSVKNLPLMPQEVKAGSEKLVWWVCYSGHEWQAVILNRKKGNGCPVCAGKTIVLGINDLASQYPVTAQEWDDESNDLSPQEVFAHSSKVASWKCVSGHQWKARIASRTDSKSSTGCPVCASKKLIVGINDAATVHPHLVELWNDKTAMESYFSGSEYIAQWKCALGHSFTKKIYDMTQSSSCPVCSGHQLLSGFNDLFSKYPELAKYWDADVNPAAETIIYNSMGKYHWTCPQGHQWQRLIKEQRIAKNACPQCLGQHQYPVDGESLSEKFPLIAKEWDYKKNYPFNPAKVTYASSKRASWICEKNHEWDVGIYSRTGTNTQCPTCQAQKFVSRGEAELKTVIRKLVPHLNVVDNARFSSKYYKYELDIYIPELKIAFEFNGVYWHSEKNVSKYYHMNKFEAAREQGIQLIQVWEDEWRDRQDIVIKLVAHKLKASHMIPSVLSEYFSRRVGARSTVVEEISYDESSALLEGNHIQGKSTGTKYLGLLDKKTDELYAVLVIKRTGGQEGTWSIERYATAATVAGGFSKLLKYAEKSYEEISQWVTFADLCVSNGGLYESLGFIEDKILPPDYKYLVRGNRVHKFNYRLKRFRDDESLIYVEGKTEKDLADLNNLLRVWDAGKIRYVKNVVR